MSVQGGDGLYSTPRKTVDSFTTMEIGYPSEYDELINDYAEDSDRPTDTVYGYVPCYTIQKLIDKHGGIDEHKTMLNA